MQQSTHDEEISARIADRTRECLSLIKACSVDGKANVIILLGDTGVGKSSLLEYITGANGHSCEALDSVTNTYQIEKRRSGDNVYFLMDTPGFGYGNDAAALNKLAEGINAVRSHARIVGILPVTPMTLVRPGPADKKLMGFVRQLCGDEYLPQVTIVTTFWDAHEDKEKITLNKRLSDRIPLWTKTLGLQQPVEHYQHGRKYEDGQATGEFLSWDGDRCSIERYARDMIDSRCGTSPPCRPRIVRELEAGSTPEQTSAGRFLNLTSIPSSSPSTGLSSDPTKSEGTNSEKPKRDEDHESVRPSNQQTQPKADQAQPTKGWGSCLWEGFLDVASNVQVNLSVAPRGAFQGPGHGPSTSFETARPRFTGGLDPLSSVDAFKARGWDSSPESRARYAEKYDIAGEFGTASHNDAVRLHVQQHY